MGTVNSKTANVSGEARLEKHEQEAVLTQFKRMTNGKQNLTFEVFREFSARYLDERFQRTVFDTLKKFRKGDKITSDNLLRFAELILGDNDQIASCIAFFDLELRSVVESLVLSLFKCEYPDETHRPVNLLVDFIMTDAPENIYDWNLLSKWVSRSVLLSSIVKRIFRAFLMSTEERLIPQLAEPTVLSHSALCAIALQLPAEIRYQWRLLYSSQTHGESFIKLLKAVDGAGPCLIVIETEKGRVIGGFANEGFVCGPKHTGDSRCFLFQDRFKLAIYNATGFNENFAYLNHQQASLPNGLGIGGEKDHWCFFLHEEYRIGTSSPGISTFEKCWLANETRFKIRSVEAWRIGEEVKRKRYDSDGNEIIEKEVSALDRDPEAKAILELAGRKTHGDPFREPSKDD